MELPYCLASQILIDCLCDVDWGVWLKKFLERLGLLSSLTDLLVELLVQLGVGGGVHQVVQLPGLILNLQVCLCFQLHLVKFVLLPDFAGNEVGSRLCRVKVPQHRLDEVGEGPQGSG